MISIDAKMIGIITLIIILLGGLYYYWFVPVKIEIIELAQIDIEEELPGTWWSTAYYSIQKDYNIDLPDIDLNTQSYLVSGGREVKDFSYRRISKFQVPYKERPYIGTAVFKKELYPNTIFVYSFSKVSIIYDDINWPDVKIED